MATEESISLTEEEKFEIDNSLCMIYTRLKGRLKSITVQDQRGFINYGRQRDKLIVDLAESNYTIIDKNTLNALNVKNNVSFYFFLYLMF